MNNDWTYFIGDMLILLEYLIKKPPVPILIKLKIMQCFVMCATDMYS